MTHAFIVVEYRYGPSWLTLPEPELVSVRKTREEALKDIEKFPPDRMSAWTCEIKEVWTNSKVKFGRV